MPETVDQSVAVRAMAFIRPSKWRIYRPLRLVCYDDYWGNGRVDFGVCLSKVMYGGYPADFAAVDESVHAQRRKQEQADGWTKSAPLWIDPPRLIRTRQETLEGRRGSMGGRDTTRTRRRTARAVWPRRLSHYRADK